MSSGLDAAERLKSELGSLLEAGRSVAREYGAAGGSFRRLLLSDISLARVALIRGLVFLLLCVIMVGTAWATAMVLLVVGLAARVGEGGLHFHEAVVAFVDVVLVDVTGQIA